MLGDETNWTSDDANLVAGQSWSDAQYTDAVNFACKLYAQKKKTTYKEDSIAISAIGEVSTPSDYLDIVRVIYSTVELVPSTMYLEYLKNPSWRSATGAITRRWVLTDGDTIKLTPVLSSWSSGSPTCTVGYVEAPAALVNAADNIDTRILPEHHEFLKYAAASWLLKFRRDQQSAQLEQNYLATFNQLIGVK